MKGLCPRPEDYSLLSVLRRTTGDHDDQLPLPVARAWEATGSGRDCGTGDSLVPPPEGATARRQALFSCEMGVTGSAFSAFPEKGKNADF